MSKIRIGIIGCGQIAQSHLKSYAAIPEAEVVAVCDIDEAAAQKSATEYGVGQVFTDFRKLLAVEEIDAVDVCLHNNFHAPLTIAGLEAGKHVYCEKPIAGSFVDGKSMVDKAKALGKHLHIQLGTLYSDETRAARELIEAGELGEVYHARSSGFRRRGRPYVDGYGTPSFVRKATSSGGAMYDMGVYHISQILYLMGNPEVERISGKTYQRVAMDPARQQSSGYDVEELGVGFVRLAGDRSLELIESWAANLDTFDGPFLLGSLAGVRLSPFGFFKNVGALEFNSQASMGSARFRWNTVGDQKGLYGESQEHWIAALQGRVELINTAEVALNTMLVSEGVYLSQALGREVTAEEVLEKSVSTAIKL